MLQRSTGPPNWRWAAPAQRPKQQIVSRAAQGWARSQSRCCRPGSHRGEGDPAPRNLGLRLEVGPSGWDAPPGGDCVSLALCLLPPPVGAVLWAERGSWEGGVRPQSQAAQGAQQKPLAVGKGGAQSCAWESLGPAPSAIMGPSCAKAQRRPACCVLVGRGVGAPGAEDLPAGQEVLGRFSRDGI